MAKPKDKASLIQDITNRFKVTSREARDIITAVGTLSTVSNKNQGSKANKNIVKQIKETAVAAATGKKGTSSDQATMKKFKNKPNTYTSGTKRK